MLLDRGEQLDWFGSGEIIDRGDRRGLGVLSVSGPHLHGRASRSFARRCSATAISRPACCSSAIVGLTYYASLALQPPYLQTLMGYPVVTAGMVMGPRGIGTMAAMMIVGRLVGPDRYAPPARHRPRAHRLVVLRDDRLDTRRVANGRSSASGVVQGAGLGFLFVPLSAVDVLDAAACISAPRAPGSTICRATSARASASRWSTAC